MVVEVGSVVEGKISGIMNFGAFVSFGDNKVGLVHISEVSDSYVSNINDVLKVGEQVKAKVIKIDDSGKISLSIKKAQEKKKFQKNQPSQKPNTPIRPADIDWTARNDSELSFEDKLTKFKQDSDEKMLALKRSNESKRSGGYRRGGSSF